MRIAAERREASGGIENLCALSIAIHLALEGCTTYGGHGVTAEFTPLP